MHRQEAEQHAERAAVSPNAWHSLTHGASWLCSTPFCLEFVETYEASPSLAQLSRGMRAPCVDHTTLVFRTLLF